MPEYTKENYARVAFPLGGIGAGAINLAGNGALVDCSFRNVPSRHSGAGFSNFSVKAEQDGKVIDVRLLNGDCTVPDYDNFSGRKWCLSGIRHFENCRFSGEFPFADITMSDGHFPGLITLSGFSPFIPMNDRDSSIPAAFFSVKIKNNSGKPTDYTVALSFTNILHKLSRQHFEKDRKYHTVTLESAVKSDDLSEQGSISIATDSEDYSYQEYWFRTSEHQPSWMSFDRVRLFFSDFSKAGKIENRHYEKCASQTDVPDTATVTATVSLKPDEEKEIRFVLSWFVPRYKKTYYDSDNEILKNYYTKFFSNSSDVAEYCFDNWDRLYSETKCFKDALFSSDLPSEVMDAIQANIATLKTPTCLRNEEGNFWAWEGIQDNVGSCYGTCQHVWNYAYALPFLFPKLEKRLREDEFKYSLDENGRMNFRMKLPFEKDTGLPCCVDGQMGSVIKAFREWKISGDNEWLKENWKYIKKCIEFAWSKENPFLWDPKKSGVITGRQHHTLDIELFGVHAWLTGFYHAALLAGAEMAEAVGETETAKDYKNLYEKGHKWLEENTFNGEYYTQYSNFKDKSLLDKYDEDTRKFYWNEELSEICFQLGGGCEIDQVLADFHTALIGLPEVFDREHKISSLKSIYKYNFLSMRELVNSCRIFASDDEKGLVMCRWPEGSLKPESPILYSDECMTGFEYAAACNMLMCGLEKEALEIVRAVRERYDGAKRNPWSEIECGASYARAMSSYAFLLAYSGFKFDMTKKMIGFKPIKNGNYFWSVDGAWGTANITENALNIKLLYGKLELLQLVTSLHNIQNVNLNGEKLEFGFENDTVCLKTKLQKGDSLVVN